MSLRAPTFLGLIDQLQRHGLSYAQVLEFALACRAKHSGPIVFQLAQGRIRTIEVQPSRRQAATLRHE